jgi:hypothetical protein
LIAGIVAPSICGHFGHTGKSPGGWEYDMNERNVRSDGPV